MARVVYGAGLTELIGSIGGMTFQRNSSGYIARLKPNTPVNPSAAQTVQENYLASLVASWGSLSISDKDSWDTFAAAHTHFKPWGDEKTLNGFQWYVSCNLNLLITNQATIDTAPAWTAVAPPGSFTLAATVDHFTLTFDSAIDITGYRLMIYATHLIRMNSEKLRRSILFIKMIDGGAITDLWIEGYYDAVFHTTWATIFAGSNASIIVHCKLIQEGTGLAGTFNSGSIKL